MGNLRRALPPLTSLVVFEAAARHLNFTNAAKELFVTREAVSRQIKILESFLGTSLFERSKKPLSLTAAGEMFIAAVSPSIENIAQAAHKVIQNPDINAEEESVPETTAESLDSDVDKPKILLVDDEPMNIMLISEILSSEFEIISETNGRYAVKTAQETPDVDLILLDVQMPSMSGYDVCKELKNNILTEEIPVIFLTVLDDEDEEEQGLKLGASDYVSRPVKPAILRSRIRTHVELKRSRDTRENMLLERSQKLRKMKTTIEDTITALQSVKLGEI